MRVLEETKLQEEAGEAYRNDFFARFRIQFERFSSLFYRKNVIRSNLEVSYRRDNMIFDLMSKCGGLKENFSLPVLGSIQNKFKMDSLKCHQHSKFCFTPRKKGMKYSFATLQTFSALFVPVTEYIYVIGIDTMNTIFLLLTICHAMSFSKSQPC